jgi:hypothetical protein
VGLKKRVVVLGAAAENFDKAFNAWKLEVESSLTSIKLELSKFNSFFTHCAGIRHHQPSRAPRQHTSSGLWVWGVYTHIHDPVKGTFYPSPRPLENPKSIDHASLGSGHTLSSQGTMGLGAKHLLGKLPKMNFPKFEGENPRLRQSCCELF